MTHGSLRIAGSSGALPAWVGIAKAVASSSDTESPLKTHEGVIDVAHAPGLIRIAVAEADGLAQETSDAGAPRVLVSRSNLVSTDLGGQAPVREPEEAVDPEAIRAMERWIRGVRAP